MIVDFDLNGIYPGDHHWHSLWERGVHTRILPKFKGLVDHYSMTADLLKIKETTLKRNISPISNFLYALQGMGCNSLIDVNEEYVLSIFSDDGKSAGYKNRSPRILMLCTNYSESCQMIASFLPPIHNKRTNIQYITEEEVTALRTCADNGDLPLGDKTILFQLL